MMSKNLLDQSLTHIWYNVDPKIKGISITLERYEYYLKQELIAKALIRFIENNGFIVVQEKDNLYIEKKNDVIAYEKWGEENGE